MDDGHRSGRPAGSQTASRPASKASLAPGLPASDPLWYKDAIIYQVHIKAFFDSSGDGIGDFDGLVSKLDYIQDLGVTALWLLPFYPSPLRDDGYDIADFRNVNPAYGNIKSFRRLVHEAHRRGLRIITELVVNHTSDQHAWFQRAQRAKPGSAARNFYVWSDSDEKYAGTRIIFTDTETSNWAWDPVANAYYWHRFFSHQPDLNYNNPQVVKAVLKVMQFWLDMGVDGLRLDAIPYLCEREGTNNENLPETHEIIRRLRAALDQRYQDRMLLGEANQWPEDVRPYFGQGNGDECHMAFHFPLMPRIYMALALEDRHPVTDIMRQTPDIPENCQWAIFLRNHDELTLEMVSDRERDYLWTHYAADPRMRVNVGIRRRLAPLLDNDRRKIELLNSLLMSMPGTPIIYYGDEIGMGDNIFLGDRDSVRTPMQWSPDRNAGFSRADPAQLYLPPIMDPVYGYQAINVESQTRNTSSLLNWMRRLLNTRRMESAFGRGSLSFLTPGNRKILAYLRVHKDNIILCAANLSRATQPVELDLSPFKGRVPVELLSKSPFPPIGDLPYFLTLPPHGFYWFRLAQEAEIPAWHEAFSPPLPEFTTLVIPGGWDDLLQKSTLAALETQALRDYLPAQRWFAGKQGTISGVKIISHAPLTAPERPWAMAWVEIAFSDGKTESYQLPLSIVWDENGDDPILRLLSFALARVRRTRTVGVLCDALADEAMPRDVVRRISAGETIDDAGVTIRFQPTSRFAGTAIADDIPVARLGGDQSNSSLLIGDTYVLKFYRRLGKGGNPEIEMGRFLTETAKFPHTPALLGTLEEENENGDITSLAVLHEAVPNQGDLWQQTRDYLRRFLDDVHTLPATGGGAPAFPGPGVLDSGPHHEIQLALMRVLGRRVAEMHHTLCPNQAAPAFRPVPARSRDIEAWRNDVRRQARHAMAALRRAQRKADDDLFPLINETLARDKAIQAMIKAPLPGAAETLRIRIHGDLHLGQVLVDKNNVFIIDFEGEPARPLSQRRHKDSPLRDVAGMLRSLDYAAWSSLLESTATRPEWRATLTPWAMEWRQQATAAFLDGYEEAASNAPFLPEKVGIPPLLRLFLLQKALYEIAYEASNRPDWLSIPLHGLHHLLDQGKIS